LGKPYPRFSERHLNHHFVLFYVGFSVMVTNLPPEAQNKWAEVVACRSTPEKIKLMREFISLVPKHKGTSKLLANVRRRIATLEREIEKSKAQRKTGRSRGFSVPKEGAGQIIILGPTNVGRSSLLTSLTNAKVEITPVFYATRKPIIGMLPYEDIQFQLVEAPALVDGASDGKMEGPQILGLARNADGLILMVDLAKEPLQQLQMLRSELDEAGITIVKPEGEVEIAKWSSSVGVRVAGGGILADCTVEDVRRLLNAYHIGAAVVKIRGKVGMEDIEGALFSSNIYKPTIIIANKTDIDGAEEKLLLLKESAKDEGVPALAVSCKTNEGLGEVAGQIFQMLGIVRVYAKEPDTKEPSGKPVVVEEGTSVIDVAKKLHSKLYRRFRYARIWGSSAKHPGQKVGSGHILKDGDVVEIH